jgi:hypothetical protein
MDQDYPVLQPLPLLSSPHHSSPQQLQCLLPFNNTRGLTFLSMHLRRICQARSCIRTQVRRQAGRRIQRALRCRVELCTAMQLLRRKLVPCVARLPTSIQRARHCYMQRLPQLLRTLQQARLSRTHLQTRQQARNYLTPPRLRASYIQVQAHPYPTQPPTERQSQPTLPPSPSSHHPLQPQTQRQSQTHPRSNLPSDMINLRPRNLIGTSPAPCIQA